MSTESLVLSSIDHSVLTIRLNRPTALNALTYRLRQELLELLLEAEKNAAVRAVLITGVGRAFSVGQDVKEMQEMYAKADPDLGSLVRDEYNPLIAALLDLSKPTIALVQGPAVGGGLSLALACDIRVITDSASFIPAFVKVGLAPDTGASYLLSRSLGWSRALGVALSGQAIGADDAVAWGLAHHRYATVEEAEVKASALAKQWAEGPTRAMAEIRRLLLDVQGVSWRDALVKEASTQDRLGRTADHQEAVAAFLERRAPEFRGQ